MAGTEIYSWHAKTCSWHTGR